MLKCDPGVSEGGSRKFYKKLKGQIQDFKASNTSKCYSKSGTLISNPADVTKRWVEYFNDLLNGNIEISTNIPVFNSTASGGAAERMRVHPT